MSDTENNNDRMSMAELLDSYGPESKSSVRIGDKIHGKIISIGKESLFVDTGSKMDGVVDIAELVEDGGELPYKVGDSIDLYVVAIRHGEIILSRALTGVGGIEQLKDAYREHLPIEGRVTETCKGGFNVEVVKRRAFCPVSQIDTIYVETPADYVGKSFRFLITEFSEGGKNIVLSRRTLLEKEQEEARQAFIATLEVGNVCTGRVSRIMPYGAFVEISAGTEGMVHISEMSWSRLGTPEEVLHVGDEITVKIVGIEETGGSARKISLSMKQVGADPWSTVAERYKYGDKITGTAVRCMDYGVFVEIEPGIEGLVHISEMSYKKRVAKAQDMVKVGDRVEVMVKEIDPAARRISLSMKDAEGDPWIGISEKYRVGQKIEGIIEKKEKFGYFVTLEPGITGLLPKSKIARHHDPASLEKKQVSESISVIIESIDKDQRKVTLAPGDALGEDDWKTFSGGARQTVSSLGEKLQKALQKKK
ncbi:MAG TPA: 30S ribosomal protein S1 [Deltaproteobacteria bacterium]|nr:30S ribosomal protein S1 [Deltaproteobacteria bacterium]